MKPDLDQLRNLKTIQLWYCLDYFKSARNRAQLQCCALSHTETEHHPLKCFQPICLIQYLFNVSNIFLLALGISKLDSKYQWNSTFMKADIGKGKSCSAEENSNTVSKLSASAAVPKFSKKHHKFRMYKILKDFPYYTPDCFVCNSPYSYLPLTVVFLFINTHL